MAEQISIEIAPGERVSALVYPAAAPSAGITLLLAHDAGAGQGSDFMIRFATGFSARGIDAVTFNFCYTEQDRRVPDPNRKLEACYRAVIERLHSHKSNKLAIGGKSMGGRIASQVAAGGAGDVSGLVFLGYPLHPPGRPEDLRAKHLAQIKIPMLFVQGARDALGTPDELRPIVQKLPLAGLHVVEGGDHSFKVRKRDGVAQEDVHEAVLDRIARWLRETLRPVGEGKIASGR